jgi:hypothetical protein
VSPHDPLDRNFPEGDHMPAQKYELKKNYIGILIDRADEPSFVQPPITSELRLMDLFLNLIAIMREPEQGKVAANAPSANCPK